MQRSRAVVLGLVVVLLSAAGCQAHSARTPKLVTSPGLQRLNLTDLADCAEVTSPRQSAPVTVTGTGGFVFLPVTDIGDPVHILWIPPGNPGTYTLHELDGRRVGVRIVTTHKGNFDGGIFLDGRRCSSTEIGSQFGVAEIDGQNQLVDVLDGYPDAGAKYVYGQLKHLSLYALAVP